MNRKLDCQGCKADQSMVATKIPRFSGIVRFIGFVFVVPSILGMFMAFRMCGVVMDQAAATPDATAAAGIGIGFAMFVGVAALVGGLIGWILIMKKKVYKCTQCGFILDRD